MGDGPHSPAAIAHAYTDAVNRRAHAEAAELLAEDVELIFPGGRLIGRQAWLESRARHQPGELTEEVATDGVPRRPTTAQSSPAASYSVGPRAATWPASYASASQLRSPVARLPGSSSSR